MSVWTHVNGSIRYDGLPGIIPLYTKSFLTDLLGETVSFDDEESQWDKCSVPCGSEGSLQYELIEAGTGAVWYTVAIWGDLRDYSNVGEIKEWFSRVTDKSTKGLMVRAAVLQVEVEGEPVEVLQLDN